MIEEKKEKEIKPANDCCAKKSDGYIIGNTEYCYSCYCYYFIERND